MIGLKEEGLRGSDWKGRSRREEWYSLLRDGIAMALWYFFSDGLLGWECVRVCWVFPAYCITDG